MASDYPISSNPFRRKVTPTAIEAHIPTPAPPGGPSSSDYQQSPPLGNVTNQPVPTVQIPEYKKAAKKVRVVSPIPHESEQPRDDPFEAPVDESTSDDEEAVQTQPAPPNPFSRTLETMERPDREGPTAISRSVASPGRASMDVDTFSRMLMTGNTGQGMASPPAAPSAAQLGYIHHGPGDGGGSSTDTSSISRQSLFEPIQEVPAETPRTSHEISEPEDDRRVVSSEYPSTRKKPPPPSSRYGKLIKLELKDDSQSAPTSFVSLASPQPPTPSSNSSNSQNFFSASPRSNRSTTDLNKPLPPAPSRTSYESDRESVFDREAAGKTPEPPSPSSSVRRKIGPPPPLARRQSQLASSKPTVEHGRLSPKSEEESIHNIEPTNSGLKRASSIKAPPPPPTRRPASNRRDTTPAPLTSPTNVGGPPPTPPARGSSKSISGRPPSISSIDMSTNKRASMAPPPPPHRHGRRSSVEVESLRRASGETGRRPSGESIRQVSSPNSEAGSTSANDALAELAKLQRDIDASLKNRSKSKGEP